MSIPLTDTKLEELLEKVPVPQKTPQISYKNLYLPKELYDDIADLARQNGVGVGEAATVLIVEGAFALKAKMDAQEAARLKAEAEPVAEIHVSHPESIDAPLPVTDVRADPR